MGKASKGQPIVHHPRQKQQNPRVRSTRHPCKVEIVVLQLRLEASFIMIYAKGRDLHRWAILDAYAYGRISLPDACLHTRLSAAQVRHLKRRYRNEGLHAFVHGLRGAPSNRAIEEQTYRLALDYIRQHRQATGTMPGPTYWCRIMHLVYGITMSRETWRQRLIDANLWTPTRRVPS